MRGGRVSERREESAEAGSLPPPPRAGGGGGGGGVAVVGAVEEGRKSARSSTDKRKRPTTTSWRRRGRGRHHSSRRRRWRRGRRRRRSHGGRRLLLKTSHSASSSPRRRGSRRLALDVVSPRSARRRSGRGNPLARGLGWRGRGGRRAAGAFDKVADEGLVLKDLGLCAKRQESVRIRKPRGKTHPADSLTLELTEQPLPARVDVIGAEALLAIESHVRNMVESRRSSNLTLVDPSLLLLGRAGRLLCRRGGRAARFGGVLVAHRDLFEELGGFGFGGEGDADHAFLFEGSQRDRRQREPRRRDRTHVAGEGVKEGPILEISGILGNLMSPDGSSGTL